jgi:voltage-gated potassium channel
MDARSERMQRRFDAPVMVAALLTIPLIVIEESDFGQPWDAVGVALNWGTWLVFLAEVVVMLAVVPDRWRWVRENPIAVGVTALTPPFLSAFAPLRLLRLVRVLRLVRLAPLMRRVFSMQGLLYAALLAAVTLVAGGAAFAAIEPHKTTGNGIYWALTTMTTVGYGDLSPTTNEGKALAGVVMVVGVGFVSILTGAVAERFLAPEVEREAVEVEEELDATGVALLRELQGVRAQLDRIEAAVRQARRRDGG